MNLRNYGIFRELKWAYQRVRYGYDERIKWGFDGYFEQFIKPLKEFCEHELATTHPDNTKRIEVFTKTLKLIKDYENAEVGDEYNDPNCSSRLWEYVGRNIGYYWD